MTSRLADFDLVLTRQLERSLNRFAPAAGEVDGAAAEMLSGEREQFGGIAFGDGGGELAGVNEFKLRGLLRHSRGNFTDAMADEVDRGRPGQVEILITRSVPHIDAFAADSRGKIFAK